MEMRVPRDKGYPGKEKRKPPTFIDVFAGCGGLSLGLFMAGWRGLFAIERDSSALKTLDHNFIRPSRFSFRWPGWLPKAAQDIRKILGEHRRQLRRLRGRVALVVGGPPCQGFSFAGRRRKLDSRNQLFKVYIEFVKLVRPSIVLVENVRGIDIEHGKKPHGGRGRRPKSYAKRIQESLDRLGYVVFPPKVLRASDFGVPQWRPRVFIVGILSDGHGEKIAPDPFRLLEEQRPAFLRERGLPADRPITVREAIGDLLRVNGRFPCTDPGSPAGFEVGCYAEAKTAYQRLMREGIPMGVPADSHRFANHRPQTRDRFKAILRECRRGVMLNERERKLFKLSKHVVVPLRGSQPSHTLTTLPDDYIHYRQPRILSVREYARLQGFPDWFEFRGKYTTGEKKRRNECPRYTQVGNSVSPLLAEAIGKALMVALFKIRYCRTENS